MLITNKFSKKLKEIRKDRKISRKMLSEMTGITRTTITAYEKGDRLVSQKHHLLINKVLSEPKSDSKSDKYQFDLMVMLKRFKRKIS
ncbi:helix-turn-helix domain-containing protein [Enterococcus sp. AZ072]|uniref:helix-turn-helix domain-containing protein n=1 Tax=unclassified Enterococcus TaxID=2608891 RepID=UPI003D28886E